MNAAQIRLVQDSFRQVTSIAEAAAELFYARLFELDPNLRPLFKSNMKEQGRKLMQMIGMTVKSLDKLEQFLPAVRALGVRHVAYGVRSEDYETVGQALLWTLKQGLGDAFTPKVEAAWAEVYATLAAAMQGAAAPVYEHAPAEALTIR